MLCPWAKLGQEKDLTAGVDLAWGREGRGRGGERRGKEGNGRREEGRERRDSIGMRVEVHVMGGGSYAMFSPADGRGVR